MAKKSQKRPIRYGKHQAGCMWGLISMFDFRHNRTPQRLLSDRRRDIRRAGVATYSGTNLNMGQYFEEMCRAIETGEENEAARADVAKASVKELMEEEMINDESSKKQKKYSSGLEQKQSDSRCEGHARNNYKQNRTKKKSFDMLARDMEAARNLGTEKSYYQVAEQYSSDNPDLEILVKELFCQIYQEGGRHDDPDRYSNKSNSVLKEKLSAAIEMLTASRSTDGEQLADDALHSKELMKALQPFFMMNQELFSKLVQAPNSPFTKQTESFEDAQVEHCSNYKPSLQSNLLDGDQTQSRQDEVINRKSHTFFRRKNRSQESAHFQGNAIREDSSRITILKPGPGNSQDHDFDISVRKPLQSHCDTQNKIRSDRNPFQFSFSEIKRRLKHAMGKEQYDIQPDGHPCKSPHGHQKFKDDENYVGTESGGWYSPNRNHFYIEKYAKSPTASKRRGNNAKFVGSKTDLVNEINTYSKHGMSNIYIEAKKHISEMVTNGDEEVQSRSGRLPRTLGRILSFPEYKLSSSCSTVKEKANSFVNAHVKLPPQENFDILNENDLLPIKEDCVPRQSPPRKKSDTQSCTDGRSHVNLQSPNSDLDITYEHSHDNLVEEIISIQDINIGAEVLNLANIADSEHVIKTLDVSPEPDCSRIENTVQNYDTAAVCDAENFPPCLESNSFGPNPSLSSSVTSPSSYSITRKTEIVTNRTEKPSPVSVLEPLFIEDDISPTRITTRHVVSTIRPLKINFDDRDFSTSIEEVCLRTCMEDDGSVFEYVEGILLGSDLNWDDFLLRWISLDQLLDPSVFDEVDLLLDQPLHYRKLLFNCTNEVLVGVCEWYFGCFPGVSFIRRKISPVPKGMDLINEVWKGVEQHLLQKPTSHVSVLIRKDMEIFETWMEVQSDIEHLGREMEKVILEELIEDTVLRLADDNLECELSALLEEKN